MKIALGRVVESPFKLKLKFIEGLSKWVYNLKSSSRDRSDLPIDYRFLELLLEASGDPEVRLGLFARGVRVGPGVLLPRLPALHSKKKRWQLPGQKYPEDPEAAPEDEEAVWRSDPCWTKSEKCLRTKKPRVK